MKQTPAKRLLGGLIALVVMSSMTVTAFAAKPSYNPSTTRGTGAFAYARMWTSDESGTSKVHEVITDSAHTPIYVGEYIRCDLYSNSSDTFLMSRSPGYDTLKKKNSSGTFIDGSDDNVNIPGADGNNGSDAWITVPNIGSRVAFKFEQPGTYRFDYGCYTDQSYKGSITFDVLPQSVAIEDYAVSPSSVTKSIDDFDTPIEFEITVKPEEADPTTFDWSAGGIDPNVSSITVETPTSSTDKPKVIVNPIKQSGDYTLSIFGYPKGETPTIDNAIIKTIPIKVTSPYDGYSLSPQDIVLGIGFTEQLSLTKDGVDVTNQVSWELNSQYNDEGSIILGSDDSPLVTTPSTPQSEVNKGVASIDSNGVIRALNTGFATIKGEINGLRFLTTLTTVAPIGATLTPDSAEIKVGESTKFTLLDAMGTEISENLIWAVKDMVDSEGNSVDTGIASIDNAGNVTGLGVGTATVSVKFKNNPDLEFTSTITVKGNTENPSNPSDKDKENQESTNGKLDGTNAQGENASGSQINIEIEASKLTIGDGNTVSLNVPATLPILFAQDGTNYLPTNWAITNHDPNTAIDLVNIKLDGNTTPSGKWTISTPETDMQKLPANSTTMVFKMAKDREELQGISPSGSSVKWTIDAARDRETGNSQLFDFDVERTAFTKAATIEGAYTMTLTFDFHTVD